MANKKITDLQLRSNVSDELNFPSDDGIESYRVTAPQLFDYLRPKFTPSSAELNNLAIVTSVGSNALTVALKTLAGTDPAATDKIRIAFRSATLATGSFALREVTGALSMVVSSGSTLGQSNAQPSMIWVYLIDNAGTAELAVSHQRYTEDALVSTTAEGGAGAADSPSVMYSTTARSNVACRLIGYIVNTQTTAGTWASAGTQIQLVPNSRRIPPLVTKMSSGSGTYYPSAGCTYLEFEAVGGGGGGGAGSSGGGATGGTGGTTSFGTSFSLAGGTGGTGSSSSAQGTGGSGGAGSIGADVQGFVFSGSYGSNGDQFSSIGVNPGLGGPSPFGGVGRGGLSAGAGVAAIANSGSGGGAGGSQAGYYNPAFGGSGAYAKGLIVNPVSSYSWAVGAAGTGGAGTSAGAAGGSGFIIIKEYFT